MHNNSKKWYITDQTPIDLYFILVLFKYKGEIFRDTSNHEKIEELLSEKFKAESNVSRNSFIFVGEKNAAWYSFKDKKFTNLKIERMVQDFKIDEFLDYYYEEVINQTFADSILEKLDDEFKTNDVSIAYGKLPEDVKSLTKLDFNAGRVNRASSTFLKMLCSYEVISKIKKGKYTKNVENKIKIYPLIWEGEFSSYSSRSDFNSALIDLVKGESINSKHLFEKELIRRSKLSSLVKRATYDKRTVISKELQSKALYDYLFTDKTTREIDLEYTNSTSSNAMYINSTINLFNLDKESRKWFSSMNITKADAIEVLDRFITISSNSAEENNEKHDEVFASNFDDLFVNRGVKRTTSKRDPSLDQKASATAQKNGKAAEEYVFEELKKASVEKIREIMKLSNDEYVKEIIDTFSVDSNAGYDIAVETNKAKYTIEVKNVASTNKGSFFISANELKKLNENENAFIALRTSKDIRVLNFKDISEFIELIPQTYSATFRFD